MKLWAHGCRETRRLWIHAERSCLGFEIGRPRFSIDFHVERDGERTIGGGFMGFHWNLDSWSLGQHIPPQLCGSFRFYWHEFALWLQLWGNDWEWRSKDPWWKKCHSLHFDDLVLGKADYKMEKGEVFENVVLPLPEGNFTATMTYQVQTWKRPRWFARVRKSTDIRVEKPPSFPGKGENSWDCGDDGIYGMSTDGHSLPAAIGGYVKAVMEYRLKRQGMRALRAVDKGETDGQHS